MCSLKSYLRVMPMLAVLALTSNFTFGAGGNQDGNDGWESVRCVAPGSNVRVVLNNVQMHEGKLKAVSDNAISITTPSGEQIFARNSVVRVSAKRESHRKRNLLIGLAAGAVGGVILGVADPELGQGTCEQGSCIDAGTVAITTVGGAALGALVGAVIPTGGWQEVYRTPEKTSTQ